ncbi:MAG: chalcone isomerase family protein [Burkholderiaceae bacterium]|nr:chalcone isomerase family protein [Roseateles sp.]MBV8470243.1 chalcone isomerase family protein [Burkholderiaceae bacterium]
MKFLSLSRIAALAAVLVSAISFNARALDIEGVTLAPTVKVGGKELKLNGAGVRTKFVVKVYVLGLYLPEKKDTTEGVLESQGPRRFSLTMLREISGDDFGQAFMSGITANTDKAERSKYVNQLSKFGEAFVTVGSMNKGDNLTADWVPGTGMVMNLNGKPVGEPLPDEGFYNAVLKIWLGEKAVDSNLKPRLLGKT